MKKLLTCISLLFIQSAFAQKDTIIYTMINNNPRDIPHTSISLSPVNLVFGVFNPVVAGYEIGFKTAFENEKYTISALYDGCYGNYFDFTTYSHYNDGWTTALNSDATSPRNSSKSIQADLKAYNSLEVKFGYAFKEITDNESSSIEIYTLGNTTYYINASVTERRILKLNLGYKSYNSGVNIFSTNKSQEDLFYEATDGTKFYQNDIKYGDVDYQNVDPYSGIGGEGQGWNTQLDVKSIFVGISKTKIANYII